MRQYQGDNEPTLPLGAVSEVDVEFHRFHERAVSPNQVSPSPHAVGHVVVVVEKGEIREVGVVLGAGSGLFEKLPDDTTRARSGTETHTEVALPRLVPAGEGAGRPRHARELSSAEVPLSWCVVSIKIVLAELEGLVPKGCCRRRGCATRGTRGPRCTGL